MKKLLLSVMCFASAFLVEAKQGSFDESLENQSKRLFMAVRSNSFSAVKNIVKYGVEINALENGKTALDIAVEYNHKKIARYLVQHGGKVTTECNANYLKNYLRSRSLNFFWGGLFFMWPLWFGSLKALNDLSNVSVLQK